MQTVSELSEQIKSCLESTFMHVSVKGELSRVTYHVSGHVYFTLKDENASISCVMFKSNEKKLKFTLEDSLEVFISGSLSVYAPRGSYQINCVSIEPCGSGALAFAYEQLKKQLSKDGYFDQKRQFVKIPKLIALVTSKTGAVLQDMKNVAKKRWPLVKLVLFDTLVQGQFASKQIANAIKNAQKINPDIIIVARGGGSVEDLWAFNEKEVALALYESKVPTMSAIGHAIDVVISDFVADKTAPTPSAAMNLVLPDINEMYQSIDNLMDNFNNILSYKINANHSELLAIQTQLNLFSPTSKIKSLQEQVSNFKSFLDNAMSEKLKLLEANIEALNLAFESKNPDKFVQNGYVQITKNDKIINLQTLKVGDEFYAQNTTTNLLAKVIKISQ